MDIGNGDIVSTSSDDDVFIEDFEEKADKKSLSWSFLSDSSDDFMPQKDTKRKYKNEPSAKKIEELFSQSSGVSDTKDEVLEYIQEQKGTKRKLSAKEVDELYFPLSGSSDSKFVFQNGQEQKDTTDNTFMPSSGSSGSNFVLENSPEQKGTKRKRSTKEVDELYLPSSGSSDIKDMLGLKHIKESSANKIKGLFSPSSESSDTKDKFMFQNSQKQKRKRKHIKEHINKNYFSSSDSSYSNNIFITQGNPQQIGTKHINEPSSKKIDELSWPSSGSSDLKFVLRSSQEQKGTKHINEPSLKKIDELSWPSSGSSDSKFVLRSSQEQKGIQHINKPSLKKIDELSLPSSGSSDSNDIFITQNNLKQKGTQHINEPSLKKIDELSLPSSGSSDSKFVLRSSQKQKGTQHINEPSLKKIDELSLPSSGSSDSKFVLRSSQKQKGTQHINEPSLKKIDELSLPSSGSSDSKFVLRSSQKQKGTQHINEPSLKKIDELSLPSSGSSDSKFVLRSSQKQKGTQHINEPSLKKIDELSLPSSGSSDSKFVLRSSQKQKGTQHINEPSLKKIDELSLPSSGSSDSKFVLRSSQKQDGTQRKHINEPSATKVDDQANLNSKSVLQKDATKKGTKQAENLEDHNANNLKEPSTIKTEKQSLPFNVSSDLNVESELQKAAIKKDTEQTEYLEENKVKDVKEPSTSKIDEQSLPSSVASDLNDDSVLQKVRGRRIKQTEDLQDRKEKAIKEMEFLLKNSQKYSKFFLTKLRSEPAKNTTRKPLQEVQIDDSEIERLRQKHINPVKENIRSDVSQLKYFEGTLYPYQIEGFKWLKLLFDNMINGILADEMGLGKTVQVIALICNLIENKVPGPYLIIAPLSTLPNWVSEFKRFAPKIPVILFHGDLQQRNNLKNQMRKKIKVGDFATYPVVICSYLYPVKELIYLQRFRWQYIVVDEGHRIKNYECQLIRALKTLVSANRLILTGTPLQNNLLELWALLNFLLPQIFPNADTFSSLFEVEDFHKTDKIIEQEQNTNIISTLHGVLGPFMLRRLKSDVLINMVPKKEVLVYCPLTDFQRELYKYVLQKNIAKLKGKPEDNDLPLAQGRKKRKCTLKIKNLAEADSDDEFEQPEFFEKQTFLTLPKDKKEVITHVKMANPMMLMKKIVNHPFTVHCPVFPGTREVIVDEEIVINSGKMLVLDSMLKKLKEAGHKVLIFCTMTQILDFIEDYMSLRDFEYCRLDGSISDLTKRQISIDTFNNDPNIFCFLISTRAGGLGLNLTKADTVILYDRDWNPQVDIQAQDRCHRIGQTRPVVVYSLISRGTVDEKILHRANAKRRLEKIVIKKGKFTNPEEQPTKVLDLEELEELLKSVDHNQVIQPNSTIYSEEELAQLLDRSDLYREMAAKKAAQEN